MVRRESIGYYQIHRRLSHPYLYVPVTPLVQKTLGQGHSEPLALTIGRELCNRYLNHQWIKGMQKENYTEARAI